MTQWTESDKGDSKLFGGGNQVICLVKRLEG